MKLLCVATHLEVGVSVSLPEDVQHRLYHVMRMGPGDVFHLMNGVGQAAVAEINDKKCRTVTIVEWLPEKAPLTLRVLALGIPKRDAWESALRQATELGVTHIVPIKTRYSQVGKLNLERAQLILREAAEQSERYVLPSIASIMTLEDYVSQLSKLCLWAYERQTEVFTAGNQDVPDTVLIGPEGGFSPEEVTMLKKCKFIKPMTFGPTILRTDTAVVAGLSTLGLFASLSTHH